MKIIAIDMDEVIADTIGHYLKRYNAEFCQNLTPADFYGRRVFEAIDPRHVERCREYFEEASFFADIPVMPGAQEVVRELTDQYEVFITTAAMEVPSSFAAKFNWLQRHFPFIPTSHIVFCGDKSILAADYMIDDNVRHFRRFRGEGIIYTAPHNVYETAYRRVSNWEEVREMFLGPAELTLAGQNPSRASLG
jgi:5'(3')-deoxyribonucleotidase